MELSFFLAKVVGIFVLIKAIVMIMKRKEINDVVEDFFKDKTLLMFAGSFELIIGLLIVNSHNIWVNGWPVIITILGWMMVIEGTFIAVSPTKKVVKVFKVLMSKRWYTIWTIVALVVGVYLTYVGFGM